MKRSSPLRRTGRLSPVSKKRKREARTYTAKKKAFLQAHPWCQAFLSHAQVNEDYPGAVAMAVLLGCPRSVDIHHKAGRTGSNYLDESTWMAVSRLAHDWIHTHPKEARKRGWLV